MVSNIITTVASSQVSTINTISSDENTESEEDIHIDNYAEIITLVYGDFYILVGERVLPFAWKNIRGFQFGVGPDYCSIIGIKKRTSESPNICFSIRGIENITIPLFIGYMRYTSAPQAPISLLLLRRLPESRLTICVRSVRKKECRIRWDAGDFKLMPVVELHRR